MRRQSFLTIVVLILSIFRNDCIACTTVVISGRITADGRPLLWKNRDAWQPQNELVYDNSGQYRFVGIANAEAFQRIRMGTNTTGFCIENSVSKDLVGKSGSGPGNGELIRLALQTCQTAHDFEKLLIKTNETGRRTRGNFGVIDAQGNAMMFEVGPSSFQAFNANDTDATPEGFIVRSNFSETARRTLSAEESKLENVYSADRFKRAHLLISQRLRTEKIDTKFLLQNISRDVAGCSACNFSSSPDTIFSNDPDSINTSSTLNRNMTVSAVVFHGVANNESPKLTTMWALLGEPLFTVAIPCWADQGGVASSMNGNGFSPLCDLSIQLRKANYNPTQKRILTGELQKVTEKIRSVENEIFEKTNKKLQTWREKKFDVDDLREVHEAAATIAFSSLEKLAMATAKPKKSAKENSDSSVEAIDFKFDDPNETRLSDAKNSVGKAAWEGGMTDCSTNEGSFRIRRNSSKTVTRYIKLNPEVRAKSSSSGASKVTRGWLVIETKGWNLRGKTTNELVRIGFTSQSEKNLSTAAIVFERTSPENISIQGVAFGDGSSDIKSKKAWPANQTKPVTFVLSLDKVGGNPGEGDSGGEYKIFYRIKGDSKFTQIGKTGKVRRLRNGNSVHFRTSGFFAAKKEFFDIDRLYFTKTNPLD